MDKPSIFPAFINDLPEIDISLPGVEGRLFQGSSKQLVFFTLKAGAEIPMHEHGPQWGIVVDGELELTIGNQTKVHHKGDTYYIPPGVKHGGKALKDTFVIDLFDEADRYHPKSK